MSIFRRYLRMTWLLTKIALMVDLAYRPSFIMAVISKVLRVGMFLVFFNAVFGVVPIISGWTYEQSILLVAIYSTVELITSITFRRNLAYYFPETIHDGSFDRILLFPTSPLFWASIREIDIMDLTSLIPVIALVVYAINVNGIYLGLTTIIIVTLLIFSAIISIYAITLAICSLSFWTQIGGGPGRMAEGIMKAGQIPASVYSGFFQILFIFILPVATIATVPAQFLLDTSTPTRVVYSLLLSIVYLLIATTLWKSGLKRYNSVGG